MFSCYSRQSISDYSWEVYIVYTPVCLQEWPTYIRIEPVYGSLTCTGDNSPCTCGLQLTSRTEGRRTVSCRYEGKPVRTNKFSSSSTRSQCANNSAISLNNNNNNNNINNNNNNNNNNKNTCYNNNNKYDAD